MSVRTLETRLETMSVQDENDLGEGTRLYSKTKVRQRPPTRLHLPLEVVLTSGLGDRNVECRPDKRLQSSASVAIQQRSLFCRVSFGSSAKEAHQPCLARQEGGSFCLVASL